MPADNTAPPRSPKRGFPYWPGMVFSIVIVAAMFFGLAHAFNRVIIPALLGLATTAGLGLVAGLVVRRLLPGRAGLVRAAATLAALLVGLLMLGLITNGRAGVGPLDPLAGRPDWSGLAQVALAAAAAWLALKAWQQHPRVGPSLRQQLAESWQAARSRLSRQWRDSAAARAANRAGEWLEKARAWSLLPPLRAARPRARQARREFPGWQIVARLLTPRRAEPAGQRALDAPAAGRSRIRVSDVVEHRCPYCLEPVEPGDARGVQVCPICRTHHHADCWEVTGMCQVPHHHTEVKVPD